MVKLAVKHVMQRMKIVLYEMEVWSIQKSAVIPKILYPPSGLISEGRFV